MISLRARVVTWGLTLAAASPMAGASPAHAQTVTDALTFLLTNRSVPTDDFVRDREAADMTRATIARVMQIEFGTVPLASSASGFAYRHNRSLGIVERTSQSFGPFFVNRSLTIGSRQVGFSIAHQQTTFDALDGRPLGDGTLVATANRFSTETEPFDVETLKLRLNTRSTVVSAIVGLTDRLDLGVAVPFVTLSMSGERVDIYRGANSLQASASATATGISDVLVRAKYNVVRRRGTGWAAGAEVRLPTGDADNLLGAGSSSFAPRLTGSLESSRVTIHGDAGYGLGGVTRALDLGAAMTVVATPRLTLVGELVSRRLESLGRLTETVQPHPLLNGVDTYRLTSSAEPTQRAVVSVGAKWNVASTWLLSVYTSRPVTDAGFTAGWAPTFTLDYLVTR